MKSKRYVRFEDMTWPRPDTDLGWALRYAEITAEDRYVLAAIVESYSYLIDMPQKLRNKRVSQIRAAMKAADAQVRT